MKITPFLVALISSTILTACTDEEINNFFSVNEITVSGNTINLNDTAESDVAVEGIYNSPGDSQNPATNSDVDGNFSLQLLEDDSFYLRASKNGFVSISTARASFSDDITGISIRLLTEIEVQGIISSAFSSIPQFVNHSWIFINVFDASGGEINGQSITLSATPTQAAYLDCDGIDSGLLETSGAPCTTTRSGPMFVAYYDTAGEVTVNLGSENQSATISIGEVTSFRFELP